VVRARLAEGCRVSRPKSSDACMARWSPCARSLRCYSCRPSPRMSPWFQPSATISHAPPNPGENSLFLFLACRMMHGRLFVVEQLSSSAVGRRLKSVIRTEANASTFAPCQMKLKAYLEVRRMDVFDMARISRYSILNNERF
jgi:hypothetical protein